MPDSDKTKLLAAHKTIDDLIKRYEAEKKRADILQSELDSIDDFAACVEDHIINTVRIVN